MTKRNGSIRNPWLMALSLGVTVGGWALLGNQMLSQKPSTTIPVTPGSLTASQSVTVVLPPVPTVIALRAYATASTGVGTDLNLPPVPVVIEPLPRPQIVQAPSAPAPQAPSAPKPQAPPVANTGSSK
jgi:hypothetical protein